ncbi:MAG: hypothetical protein WBC50_08420 [Dehalococcoidales bacterium]
MEKEKIVDRLDNLIKLGDRVLETKGYIYKKGYLVDSALFQQWHTSSRALLSILPEEYIYAHEFVNKCQSRQLDDVELGVAVLRAAKDDIESGLLQDVEALISVEVFDNFLDMAEHLLENGYKDPSAFLVGAVLENGLWRICGNNDIITKSDDNIGSLNQKLFQKSIYNKPQMKQITHWQSIRDSAAHGKFEEYNAETVKNMLEGVRNFLSKFFEG